LEYSVNKREPRPEGNRSLIAAPYGPYRCAGDDRWCVIAIYHRDEWERFAALLEKSGLKRDEKFATHLGRVRHREELDRWVAKWTLARDPYDVMETLQGIDVCAAVVQDVEDQFKRDPQYAATGFLVKLNEPEAGEVVTEGRAEPSGEGLYTVTIPADVTGSLFPGFYELYLAAESDSLAQISERRIDLEVLP